MGRLRGGQRLGAASNETGGGDYEEVRAVLNLSDPDRPVRLEIARIRLDGGTQPRAKLDERVIAEYAEEMKNGATFPPVDVFYDGVDYWLADGYHRVNACVEADILVIDAKVHQGTRRDAVLFSVGVNAEHGLRRTNEDKRRAVTTLMEDAEWRQWSNYEVARRCHVSEFLVRSLRESHYDKNVVSRTYVNKHGTKTTMKTGRIGKSKGEGKQSKSKAPAPRYIQDEYAQPGYEEDYAEYDEPTTASTSIPDINVPYGDAQQATLHHLHGAAVSLRLLGMDDHAQGLEEYAADLKRGWQLE